MAVERTLQNMTYAKVHGDMPGGWWDDVPPQMEVKYRDLPISDTTFTLKHDRGVAESLVVDQSLDEWEVNLVQGLVSQLQLDLTGANALHQAGANVEHGGAAREAPAVYRVMEDGVVGRCEVMYEVAPLSAPVLRPAQAALCGSKGYLEVTKTRNYDNCETNAEYHFGLPGSAGCRPGSNQCGDFWARSSLTRVQGCGDRKDFVTLSSISSSQILANLHFHNGSQAAVHSYLNVTLLSAKAITKRFSPPAKPQTLKSLFFRPTSVGQSGAGSNSSSTHHAQSDSSSGRHAAPKSSREHHKSRHSAKGKRPKRTHRASAEEEDDSWRLAPPDAAQAPHLPFSTLGLAYRSADDRTCLGQQLKDLVTDIATDVEANVVNPEKMTLAKVATAVQVTRLMSLSDLRRAVGNAIEDKAQENPLHRTERKVYRDILTMSGTDPAFLLVKSWVEERKVRGEEAAEILASLPSHLLTPSRTTVKQFFDLVRSPAVRDDAQLKTTAVLSLSNLARAACTSEGWRSARYASRMFGPACAPADVAPFVAWLVGQVKADPAMRLVYFTALGNTGSPAALPHLKSAAGDAALPPMHRALAVYSMKYSVFRDPAPAVPHLLSLFHNARQPSAVRIAAASLLFYAQPPAAVWQRLAVSTWYDSNPTVAAFVSSSLASLATLRDPLYANMTAGASSAAPLSKTFSSVSLYRPYNFASTSVSDRLKEVVLQQLTWVPGAEATSLYYRHSRRLSGFSRVNLDGEMWLADPDTLLSALCEMADPSGGDVSRARPPLKGLPRATRWLRDTLKIAEREMRPVEGMLRFKLDHLTERMFSFDKKIVADLAKAARKLLSQARTETTFHYQKMDQSTTVISAATEMGFPVSLQVNVPWIVRASGRAVLDGEKTEVQVDATLAASAHLMGELSLYTAWDHTAHVAAAHAYTEAHLPATRITAQLHSDRAQLEVAVAPMESSAPVQVAHHRKWAFTTQADALSLTPISLAKSTQNIRKREAVQRSVTVAPNVQVTFSSEVQRFDPLNDLTAVHGFPLMMASMDNFAVEVTLMSPAPVTMQLGLGCATAYNGTVRVTRSPGLNTNPAPEEGTVTPQFPSGEYTESTTSETTESTTSEATESTTSSDVTTEATIEASSVASNESASGESVLKAKSDLRARSDEKEDQGQFTIHSTAIDYSISDFNPSIIDTFEHDADEIYEYLLNRTLAGISSGHAHVVGLSVQVHATEAQQFQLFASYAAAIGGRHRRIGLFHNNQMDSAKLAWTSVLETPSLPVVNIIDILFTPVLSRFNSDFVYQSADNRIQWGLQGTVMRSWRRVSGLHVSNVPGRCGTAGDALDLTCRAFANDALYLDRYTINVTMNEEAKKMIPKESVMDRAMEPLLPYLASSTRSDDPTAAHTLRLTVEMAQDQQSADIFVSLPEKDLWLSEVPISALTASLLEFRPENSIPRRVLNTGYCGLSYNKVVTYDGVVADYKVGDCWHLLTKDCSGKSRVAVLAKSSENQTLELEINLDNYKVISVQAGPWVRVNDKRVPGPSVDQVAVVQDLANVTLAHITASPDAALKIALPAHGLSIVYTNATVFVVADAGMEGRMCGLCGDMDRKMDAEFRSPSDRLERTAHAFGASYAIPDKECKHRPDRKP